MIGVALIAAGMAVAILAVHLNRARRRRQMNLPRMESDWSNVQRPESKPLPRREKGWTSDPSVEWSSTSFYNGAKRRLERQR